MNDVRAMKAWVSTGRNWLLAKRGSQGEGDNRIITMVNERWEGMLELLDAPGRPYKHFTPKMRQAPMVSRVNC